ncbi:hypothetical protein MLD38_028422 [Melastoma candidum]|uniref:Uncharacterized protein n=1 Tax=Melastoma candidum TaxID=119954 RepID=A0ACB9N2K4_9MYRT|nr:hypothetical protein MLD38_028422 [Melastoma candidum]
MAIVIDLALLYKRNGILPMLKRNYSVKAAPQRWQDNDSDGVFDMVMTFEEKVFDMVLEDLHTREQSHMKPVLMINLEVKDNHEEVATGAQLDLDLCREIDEAVESGKIQSMTSSPALKSRTGGSCYTAFGSTEVKIFLGQHILFIFQPSFLVQGMSYAVLCA